MIPPALVDILQCPVCTSALSSLHCNHCNSEFFTFGGVLSLMPAGRWQRHLWQHQLALNNQQAQGGMAAMQALLERSDLVPASRQRIEESRDIAQASLASIEGLLAQAGLTPVWDEQFNHLSLGPISEYYHHILQDWAWGDATLHARLAPLLSLEQPQPGSSLLALGAGAGRLSWELHQRWRAGVSLATDINPLLLAASHRLIVNQEAFTFYELNSFPQITKARSAAYSLEPACGTEQARRSWHAVAADVWHMPIKPNSLDIVLTAWFIDVHGGDNRALISLIQRWLKPGGRWINSGPLLYPKATPMEQKYDRDELLELMQVAGLICEEERLDEQRHLMSPINVRTQTEQVWTFSARKAAAPPPSDKRLPPAWLLFHHLPVPQCFMPPAESHPLIDQLLAHLDGQRSIEALAAATARHFPDGLDPQATIVDILGELWRSGEAGNS